MAKYDYGTRREITIRRNEQLEQRMKKLTGNDKKLAQEVAGQAYAGHDLIGQIAGQFYQDKQKKPSEWFRQKGMLPGTRVHKALLDAFVPTGYQESFLYIIDKLNQFPFTRGWYRRVVRTAGYGPQMRLVFSLLAAYEKLFYCGEDLTALIYKRLDEEKLDYMKNEWNFYQNFSLIYAAEIDRGNQAVIQAFEDLLYGENSAAYLDREMILGIFRSDNHKLHKMAGDLLVAARLQEGLRQAICETVDEGTRDAFRMILEVIEENDLIRYSSVQRAVSVWIGVFNESSVDRVNQKLLQLMGRCLREPEYCRQQLKTNDAVAVSTALWALGFEEADTAVAAMMELIDHGTKNQKLTASYYNQNLYDEGLKIRAARKVVLEQTDDLELVAAFMPAYTLRLRGWIDGLLHDKIGHTMTVMEVARPKRAVLTDYFTDQEDALRQYEKFWSIYKRLPKKGVVYDPCIFPWHRVELMPSEIICQLAFTAYVLNDEEKITQMAALLGEVSGRGTDRSNLLNLLLYDPANQTQRELLIQYMGNAEEYTSAKAAAIVKKLSFTAGDYRLMEDMLRFKRSKLRSRLLKFLEGQDDACMEACLQRLLTDKKEEKRTAGLDLLMRLSKRKERSVFYQKVQPMAGLIQKPTDKEQVLIEEILGVQEELVPVSEQAGYGIYDPDACPDLPTPDEGRDAVRRCIPLTEDEIIRKIKKLDALIREYKDYEYEARSGDKQLLGNAYMGLKDTAWKNEPYDMYCLKNYPLEEKLREYYETEIGDYGTFLEWEARILLHNTETYQGARVLYEAVFGKMPFHPKALELEYARQVQDIRLIFRYEYMDRRLLFQAALQVAAALGSVVNPQNRAVSFHYNLWNGKQSESWVSIGDLIFLSRFFEGLDYWETDEEFAKAFYAAYALELKCAQTEKRPKFYPDTGRYNSLRMQVLTPITPYWFLKAYHMRLIGKDFMYQAVLDYFDRRDNLRALSRLVKGDYAKRGLWRSFFGEEMSWTVAEQGDQAVGLDTWCGSLIRELYQTIVPVMVDTELRRGEAETVFSQDITGITYITGIPYFVRILKALGKDTLGREAYYSWYYAAGYTKKEVLSHLLKSCYPAKEDHAEALKEALKSTDIKAERLVEAAMYAPQWVDIIEQYLGMQGLKSGCYYFMAHMNEAFDDAKIAMIAKYTPLSAEELQGGAFDIDWFQEAYGLLGEKNFGMLYKAAKYISDGQKHSRARKYADAAAGKVTLEELRGQIADKRNKDLLMSYGLVPFCADRDKDLMERYQFIQNFAKEARQFGAQRRANETRAAQTALVNLSVHAGYTDVTRLILNMEGALAGEFEHLMQWTAVDDVEICLHVDETGKSGILCRKGEKMLKSVPSRLGRRAYVLEVKEAHKKLKEQYTRAKKLMEESMEDGALFTAQETAGLMGSPVVGAILKNLVFVSEEDMGFFVCEAEGDEQQAASTASGSTAAEKKASGANALGTDGSGQLWLQSWDGSRISLRQDQNVRIAHPLDLYRAGIWHTYQKYLFDHQMRQPFRQVFRELYVKLPEELGLTASKMFAGNQIQPKKTAACLRGRRWIADYEEGLQKIYYKENIIARIYALADWFSPSDIEAPTLEWVEFSDRKTFQTLTIEQVPDLIYSEVMRDVDMAVSVAHAGGVDPETSHSTIEMRRAVVEFNLPLFGIKNVVLKEGHALIRGTRGNYNVHLGSGVVHQEGGAMLNILPVHSQKRGKLFLPFVDEDPKTAEIMSKIVLLAEDKKIRDPFILQQIQ